MSEGGLKLTLERLRRLPVRRGSEVWELAVVTLPAEVCEADDAEAWNPVSAVCVSTSGGAAMSDLARPTDLPATAALDAFASFAMRSHIPGAAPLDYVPDKVRVSSMPEHVRSTFAAAMNEIGVVVETKENLEYVRDFMTCMEEYAESTDNGPIQARGLARAKGMTVDRVRAFADAAASFWDAAPWMHVPGDVAWSIEPRPKNRFLRTCVIMGAGGEEFGLAFLTSPLELHAMALRAALGQPPTPPPGTVWAMTFVHRGEAPLADQELWLSDGLPLAADEAFPVPLGLTEAGNVRRPTPEQLTLMEALLRGFANVEPEAALHDELRFDVDTFDGPVSLRLA